MQGKSFLATAHMSVTWPCALQVTPCQPLQGPPGVVPHRNLSSPFLKLDWKASRSSSSDAAAGAGAAALALPLLPTAASSTSVPWKVYCAKPSSVLPCDTKEQFQRCQKDPGCR